MDLPPRSAMFGLGMQLVGGVLLVVGFLATPGRHTVRAARRSCSYIGPDVWSTITHECRPGDNRSLVMGLIIMAIGLAAIVIGKRIAKPSGLD
jgi:hypothetical protein